LTYFWYMVDEYLSAMWLNIMNNQHPFEEPKAMAF
jgi:hypothetical protein